MNNYLQYRGKCKKICELAAQEDPTLTVVRGYYHDAFWGKQEHWWTVNSNGEIFDPTKLQFPDQNGEYEEYNGISECEQCGKEIKEEDGHFYGNFIFCSNECVVRCVL